MRTLKIIGMTACCALTISLVGDQAHGKDDDRKDEKKLTSAQYEKKYERLRASMNRVKRFKDRGSISNAIKESMEAIEIAEEEFGTYSFVNLRPLFELVELLGKKRRFEEAEQYFEKIYAITDKRDDDGRTFTVYAVGYRVWIARLYIKWNMIEEAEATLTSAQDIINISKLKYIKDRRYRFDSNYFGGYQKSINEEMKKIEEFKDLNQFKKKKKEEE